jgi:Cu(I)/Ag(I) efflux system periplasmic protein CusF
MSMRRILLAAAVVAGLPACTRTDSGPAAAEAQGPQTATGTGAVVAVDPANGTITLQHGPIAALGWPATRMAFSAPPEAIAAVKPGERVAFDLKPAGSAYAITAVRKP